MQEELSEMLDPDGVVCEISEEQRSQLEILEETIAELEVIP